MVGRSTSPKPSPHFAPPTPQNAERGPCGRPPLLPCLWKHNRQWFLQSNLEVCATAAEEIQLKPERFETFEGRKTTHACSGRQGCRPLRQAGMPAATVLVPRCATKKSCFILVDFVVIV